MGVAPGVGTSAPRNLTRPRKVTILGSTGSVGTSTVSLLAHGGYEVEALTANNNVALLAEQARQLRPRFVAVDRKSTRLNSSHVSESRMPSSA